MLTTFLEVAGVGCLMAGAVLAFGVAAGLVVLGVACLTLAYRIEQP